MKLMSEPDVKKHLEELHQKFVIVTINKASNNFAFICRKYCISKLLAEVFPNKNKNSASTYSSTLKSKEKITKANIKYCKIFYLKVFKMIFNYVEIFHRKILFYTCLKKFWVVEN